MSNQNKHMPPSKRRLPPLTVRSEDIDCSFPSTWVYVTKVDLTGLDGIGNLFGLWLILWVESKTVNNTTYRRMWTGGDWLLRILQCLVRRLEAFRLGHDDSERETVIRVDGIINPFLLCTKTIRLALWRISHGGTPTSPYEHSSVHRDDKNLP